MAGWSSSAATTAARGGCPRRWTCRPAWSRRGTSPPSASAACTSGWRAVAVVGGDEGYLVAAVQVTRPETTQEEARFAAAVRRAGGAAALCAGLPPVPQHALYLPAAGIARFWGEGDEARGMDRLCAQL